MKTKNICIEAFKLFKKQDMYDNLCQQFNNLFKEDFTQSY